MGQLIKKEENHVLSIVEVKNIGMEMVEAGLLPKGVTVKQGIMMALKCHAMGVHPAKGLSQIDVINGKIYIEAKLRASEAIKKIPGFKYQVLEKTKEKCTLKLSRLGWEPYTVTLTMQDCIDRGYAADYETEWKKGDDGRNHPVKKKDKDGNYIRKIKDKWKEDPETMIYYKTLNRGIDVIAPDFDDPSVPIYYAEPEDAQQAIADLTGEEKALEVVAEEAKQEFVEAEFVESKEPTEEEIEAYYKEVEEQQTAEVIPEKETKKTSCESCGKEITEKVKEFSLKQKGKALCFTCQKG